MDKTCIMLWVRDQTVFTSFSHDCHLLPLVIMGKITCQTLVADHHQYAIFLVLSEHGQKGVCRWSIQAFKRFVQNQDGRCKKQ
ncbi:MAG: hypothetical protein LC660_11555 [Desulfobacteraceae bacterium]|nr:hypothetical protein [Desulfobacteraceae bacterium]